MPLSAPSSADRRAEPSNAAAGVQADPAELEVSDLGAIPMGWLTRVGGGLNAVGGLVVFALLVLINVDVLGRFVFNRPISGVPEMVELAIVVIVFLQMPHALGAGRFIRSDELHKSLTRRLPRLGNGLAVVYELAGSLLLAALCAGTVPVLQDAWQHDRYVGNPGVFSAPVWPVQLSIVVGSGLAALIYLRAAQRHLRQALRGNT